MGGSAPSTGNSTQAMPKAAFIAAGMIGFLAAVAAVFALYVVRSRATRRITPDKQQAGQAPGTGEQDAPVVLAAATPCVSDAILGGADLAAHPAAANYANSANALPRAPAWSPASPGSAENVNYSGTARAASARQPAYATARMAFAPRGPEGSVSDVSAMSSVDTACNSRRQAASSDGRPSLLARRDPADDEVSGASMTWPVVTAAGTILLAAARCLRHAAWIMSHVHPSCTAPSATSAAADIC